MCVLAGRGLFAAKKFRFFLLAVLLIAVDSGHALNNSTGDGTTSLWKVESGKNTVYLLGSIHLLKQENYPLNEKMERAFEDAETVVFEMNLDSAQTPQAQQLLMGKAMYPDGMNLKFSVGDSLYEILAEKTGEQDVNLAAMSRFKPWFIAVTVAGMKLQSLGFDPQFGIDRYFFGKARKQGKDVAAFETLEYQISLFNTLSGENQGLLLLQTLEDLDIIEEELNHIITAWENGDLAEIEQTLLKSFEDYSYLEDALLVQRNKNWLTQIERFLRGDRDYLVVVGAAHMAGNNGLIQLLQDRGHNVQQL